LEHPRNPTTYSIHHGSDTYHEIIVPIPNHYLYSDVSLRNNNTDELHRASNIISTIQHMLPGKKEVIKAAVHSLINYY
jgi:hypothetical protein